MTTVAKHARGMRYRIHLRKAFGLRGIFFVAAPAEVGHVGQFGHVGDGVGSMFGQWSMARFTPDAGMLPPAVHLRFLIMAENALVLASVGNRAGADHLERPRPVVSVFPKIFGHHNGSDD